MRGGGERERGEEREAVSIGGLMRGGREREERRERSCKYWRVNEGEREREREGGRGRGAR